MTGDAMTYHLKCPRCSGDMGPAEVLSKASLCCHCHRRAKIAADLHDEAMGDLMKFMAVLVLIVAGCFLLFGWR